jgi:alpha-mannosidase
MLKCIRQQQYFTMFHDAITATHIDPAYQELSEIWHEIDNDIAAVQNTAISNLIVDAEKTAEITAINPTGHKMTGICTAIVRSPDGLIAMLDENGLTAYVLASREESSGLFAVSFVAENVAPFSARQYRVVPSSDDPNSIQPLSQPIIENDRYKVSADNQGLLAIFDKALGREIAVRGEFRPGELVLEHDEGSPWATLHPDQTRTPLAPFTRLEAAEQGCYFQRLVFSVDTPWKMGFSSRCLNAKVTVTLAQGIERVDFHVEAKWDSFNHRLRVAMPVPRAGQQCRHLYEIPYGVIERTPYQPRFDWAAANGDWPAIHWAGIEREGLSVALFNQGTPSYCMETSADKNTEIIFLSLLRSPAIPTYLHEPYFYSMLDYDGMRDSGDHTFCYALQAYGEPFNDSSAVLDANSFNAPLIGLAGQVDLPHMPVLHSPTARIAAVKWAEDGSGLVLRLVEFRGIGGPAQVELPPGFQAAELVNLLERHAEPLPIVNQSVQFTLRPWEITTLKIS